MADWPWVFFTREELQCPCGCGRCEMDPVYMWWFEAMRRAANVAFIVHSAYRCPVYDERVREEQAQEGRGYHSGYNPFTKIESKGRAIDGHWHGHWRDVQRGWRTAMYTWSGGIGLYLKGPQSGRFIHYDNGPWRVWTY